jgi:hypothetical protein
VGLTLNAPELVEVDFTEDDAGPLLGGFAGASAGEELAAARPPSPAPWPTPDGPVAGYVAPPRPRLSIGARVTRIEAASVTPPEVAQEVRDHEDTLWFSLLHICANIEYDSHSDVDEVAVGVSLEPDGFAPSPPQTWSMDPARLVKAYKSPLSVEGAVVVSLLSGIKLSARWEPGEDDQWWLLATGTSLHPNPQWVLRRRQNVDLSGAHDLRMVICHPVGARCIARLAISGRLRRGPLTWFRQVDLPGHLRTLELV